MGLKWPTNGINHTPSYQTSGIPYVTSSASEEVPNGSELELTFPYVTKFFKVKNIDASHSLKVGFTANGVNGTVTKNYFTLAAGSSSDVLEIRCKSLFFAGVSGTSGFEVIAGLTPISYTQLTGSNTITGSNIVYSEGVG